MGNPVGKYRLNEVSVYMNFNGYLVSFGTDFFVLFFSLSMFL